MSKLKTEAELKQRVVNAACLWDGLPTSNLVSFSDENPFKHAFALNVYAGQQWPMIFRRMTLDEVKVLRSGSRIWFISTDGSAREMKVNGAVKRWKRTPDRFAVPCKYGLHEYHTFTNDDMVRLIVPIVENPDAGCAAIQNFGEQHPQFHAPYMKAYRARLKQADYEAKVEKSLPPGESMETDV